MRIPIPFVEYFSEMQNRYGNTYKYLMTGGIPQIDKFLDLLRRVFFPLSFCAPDDFLTFQELSDIKQSLEEIQSGKTKEFKSVEDLITWLNE